MKQVRIRDPLWREVLAAVPETDSLAHAVEVVLVRGLTLDLDAPEPAPTRSSAPSPEVEKPALPQATGSVRRPRRSFTW